MRAREKATGVLAETARRVVLTHGHRRARLCPREVVLMEPDETLQRGTTEQATPAPPVSGPPAAEVGRRRLTIFRVLAALPVLVFFVAEFNLLAPWVFVLNNEDNPEQHRWFYVVSGSADIFMFVTFLGLIIRPRLTALAAWIVISLAIVLVAIVSLQPTFLIFVLVVAGPAAIAYPYWRDLRGWRSWWRGARPQLMALATAACLARYQP